MDVQFTEYFHGLRGKESPTMFAMLLLDGVVKAASLRVIDSPDL